MSQPDHVLNLTCDPEGVVHLHADGAGLEVLIRRLQKLQAELSQGKCEHDHFMTEAWGGRDLSEENGLVEEGHSAVHHLKVMAWTDEWAGKHGFKGKRGDREMGEFQSGFTMVFGGADFRPEDFLAGSRLAPLIDHVVKRGSPLRNGELAEESWVEFDDIHEGVYPLNAFTEARDFLRQYRDEFLRLSRFAGVTTRTLNFFGDACMIDMEPADIALLHELSLHLSICPL